MIDHPVTLAGDAPLISVGFDAANAVSVHVPVRPFYAACPWYSFREIDRKSIGTVIPARRSIPSGRIRCAEIGKSSLKSIV